MDVKARCKMKRECKTIKSFSGFVMRRIRNALLITTISLCFVFMHCHMKERWTNKLLGHQSTSQTTFYQGKIFVKSPYRNGSVARPTTKITNVLAISPTSSVTLSHEHSASNGPPYNELRPSALQFKFGVTKNTGPTNKNVVPEKSPGKTVWLNKFTSKIPYDLQELLQDILERDFEKETNFSKKIPENNLSKRCKKGFFRLRGMEKCRKWLRCSEVKSLEEGDVLGNGVGKIVRISEWKGMDVVIVSLREDRIKYKLFVDRVKLGVQNMLLAQPSPYTVQVVGVCDRGNNTVLVMENAKKGHFRSFYTSSTFRRLPMLEKFKLAIQLVAGFDYLHRGLGLPRVHCDLHTVMQAFGQWVVTEDTRLFISDLDEVPVVNKKNNTLATCECEPNGKMAQPDFLAPEIRYSKMEFKQGKGRKPVDESSDVWKFPDLFANIMVKSQGKRYFQLIADTDFDYYLKEELEHIHSMCKNHNPVKRPSAKQVLVEYLKLYQSLLRR